MLCGWLNGYWNEKSFKYSKLWNAINLKTEKGVLSNLTKLVEMLWINRTFLYPICVCSFAFFYNTQNFTLQKNLLTKNKKEFP